MNIDTGLKGKYVIVADDNDFLRLGAVAALQSAGMLVGACANFNELWALLEQEEEKVSSAIVDLNRMGIDFTPEYDIPRLVQRFPTIPIIIWTQHPHLARKLKVDEDVAGYVHKDDQASGLIIALEDVLVRKKFHYSSTIRKEPLEILSFRERDVISFLAYGHTVRLVAHELDISTHTVNEHIRRIKAKLGAINVVNAVYIAATKELIRCVL
jgi:DNA-binding NarL/FixJ family response regulator